MVEKSVPTAQCCSVLNGMHVTTVAFASGAPPKLWYIPGERPSARTAEWERASPPPPPPAPLLAPGHTT